MTLREGRAPAIDAFRGLTFVAMIFVNEVAGVAGVSPWLKHMPADADAMSFADVVFPAFLFIVGMAIPFSIAAREKLGEHGWRLQRHIVARAAALVVMGVFMVNAEEGYAERAMALPIHLWSLLFYAAVFLVWGVLRFESRALRRASRAAGLVMLAVLALLYRGGTDGRGGLVPQWWGILGLIGWAYFYSAEMYLAARRRIALLLGFLVFCVAYYALAHQAALPPSVRWVFSQEAHAAHAQIVLAGVVCALIFFGEARAGSHRRRFVEAAVFAGTLAIAATLLRPAFPISKIYATPSWCLYCAAICVAVFALLYALIEIRGVRRWTRLVEPAAASPLVTYLIPFIVFDVMSLAGLAWPAPLREGVGGLAWAALYVAIVLAVVERLNRRGVALKL